MTAVEQFAESHASCGMPAGARRYRDLIPLERPRPGQQYAFEVDLDACTGCKACVAACHSLNGLDEGEAWRTVGLLHGGSAARPAQQTVTTSCHHCLEPACLAGCPVKAYEKDPVTGIVRHLDDQCIGCQYCTLMCPYDAPKYNRARGIVRKCDMCSDRLEVGEAPACVQACPNGAIRIGVVERAGAEAAGRAGAFLAAAPGPVLTLPTTVYRSARPVPANLAPADLHAAPLEPAHLPLAVMLVFTQLAVGALAAGLALAPLAAAALGLGAAVLHLGRPRYAFRAVLGLRTSWMSREIVAFGLFAAFAALHALAALQRLPGAPLWRLGGVISGAGAIVCSAMIYAATGRAHWRLRATAPKFFATAALLGSAAQVVAGRTGAGAALAVIAASSAFKLAWEARLARSDRRLRALAAVRFAAGASGGLLLPAVACWVGAPALPLALVLLALLTAGELLERHLFFRAAAPSRMPGALP